MCNFSCFFVVCWVFSKSTFSRKSFRNTIRVSNSLDSDQARHNVGPDLDPNCLHRLSADGTSRQIVKVYCQLTLVQSFFWSWKCCLFLSTVYILAKSSSLPHAFYQFSSKRKMTRLHFLHLEIDRRVMYPWQWRYWQNVKQYMKDANLNSGTSIFKIRILAFHTQKVFISKAKHILKY